MRIFISNLRSDSSEPADINALSDVSASSLTLFEDAVGVEASDLTEDEIDRSRRFVYQYLARHAAKPLYLKTHDPYIPLADGQPLIPADTASGAIYIIRNPLDVAISFAYHLNRSLDDTIENVLGAPFVFKTNLEDGLTRASLLSWSDHVLSWMSQQSIPVHLVRYEDMRQHPEDTFMAAARFCGLPCDLERVRRAMRNSSFELLQAQEREKGFREKPANAPSFFRSGKSGAWQEVLSKSQADRIIRDHETVMRRFGYL
jgi:aryl sulfotransferase